LWAYSSKEDINRRNFDQKTTSSLRHGHFYTMGFPVDRGTHFKWNYRPLKALRPPTHKGMGDKEFMLN